MVNNMQNFVNLVCERPLYMFCMPGVHSFGAQICHITIDILFRFKYAIVRSFTKYPNPLKDFTGHLTYHVTS